MELNRENAIDLLERFAFFQGQRAGRELWNDKPFDVQEQDIAKFLEDVASLKTYIKELTEENERLQKALNTDISFVRVSCGNGKTAHLQEIVRMRVDAIKADTVSELQTRFAIRYGTYTDKDMTPIAEVFRLLDQIAKEIMEETYG